MEEYSKNIPKPKVKPARTTIDVEKERMEHSLLHGADFEGSLYDDEENGFEGAEGLDSSFVGGKKGGASRREVALLELEAEHESSKMKIEQMKAEFGL